MPNYFKGLELAVDRPLLTRDALEFYGSADGGYKAFNMSSDYVTLPNSATPEPFFMLENPAGSGIDMWLFYGEFASTLDAKFRRMRNTSVLTRGAARTPLNMGNGTALGLGRGYIRGQFTVDISAATVSKTALVGAYKTYHTYIHGVRLKPGGIAYWSLEGRGQDASVYMEWAELPAVA